MKVLKFGGTSVGTAEALQQVKRIVEGRSESVIVVVSALGGVTDRLLDAAGMAEKGDGAYVSAFEAIAARHRTVLGELFGSAPASLTQTLEGQLERLRTCLDGVFTLKVLPEKTRGEIVSYGERMSAQIAAALIDGATLYDALDFIRTFPQQGRHLLDSRATEKLVRERFAGLRGIAVVPGFIARDTKSLDITNLGRGGSDYTASILAAALDAEALEIWTDVDGFMTADPRIIKTSYVIDTLSFAEAMELCNFGAKVVYAPALYPV